MQKRLRLTRWKYKHFAFGSSRCLMFNHPTKAASRVQINRQLTALVTARLLGVTCSSAARFLTPRTLLPIFK
jgi:hypothetical protein